MSNTIDVQTSRDVRKEAQQVFVRHTDVLSSGRIPEWVDLFAEDGLLELPYGPAGFPKNVRGKAALLARASGRPYNQTYISVVETNDGLITRHRDFWNPLVAMEAVGSIGSMVDAFKH